MPVDAVVRRAARRRARAGAGGVRRPGTVHALTGAAFEAFSGAAWASGLDSVLSATGDSVVVLAAGSPRGNEVLAHLAARRGVAMAANVVAVDGQQPLTVTRQVVGGSALEDMQPHRRPAILTVAGHAVEASPARRAGPGDRRRRAARRWPPRIWWPGSCPVSDPEPDMSGSLKSARVVVGAGRGAGGADGFGDLVELASCSAARSASPGS